MRIVHITSFEKGGAGRSAFRLHQSLLACGHESLMVVRERAVANERVAELEEQIGALATKQSILFEEFQKWYINQNRTELSNTHFSLNEPGVDVSGLDWVKQADVINLHWMAGFLSPASIQALQKLGKPIVWTMHDQRPFTGGCHFSAGCDKFKTSCHGCPQIAWDPFLLSEAQLREMKQGFQPAEITWVAPSRWLAGLAGEAALLKNARIEVIPYSIDTDFFRPLDKAEARQKLGIDPHRQYLLFGADNAGEKRKGFKFLIEAIQHLHETAAVKSKLNAGELALLCLGYPNQEVTSLGLPLQTLGYINDDAKIAAAYGACDFFVLPSLEDNLPNTVMEAMSCGRPVLAFGSGGIPELVEHEINGMLASDSAGLSQAMAGLIVDPEKCERLGKAARQKVIREYPLKAQGDKYAALYQELLARSKPASIAKAGLSLAPAGLRLAEILEKSLPAPVQEHLYLREVERRALKKERNAHVATILQQNEYIAQLKGWFESRDAELKALNRQRGVKLLRKIKLLD